MRKQKGTSGAKRSPTGIQISLTAVICILIILLFGVFSKIGLVQFLGAFWATIIAVEWASLILLRKVKS
jgi:hypothetical protein